MPAIIEKVNLQTNDLKTIKHLASTSFGGKEFIAIYYNNVNTFPCKL